MPEKIDLPHYKGSNAPEYIATADFLNNHLKNDGTTVDVSKKLQELPRPILVDYNNVLVSSNADFVNPEAGLFLERLRNVGNVIVWTSSLSWERAHRKLNLFGLWQPDTILVTSPNYVDMSFPSRDGVQELIDRFIQLNPTRRISVNQFKGASVGEKKVAPLFQKTFEIPLIDDSTLAVDDNPGILGILVKRFPVNGYLKSESGAYSLSEAAEFVEQYYNAQEITLSRRYDPKIGQLQKLRIDL